jgi:hypothetical protein
MRELEVKIMRRGARELTLIEDAVLFGVLIPKGFTCDGATVPRALWWVLSPLTDGMYAAIVHDFRLKEDEECANIRRMADEEFFRNLRSSGLNLFRATTAYIAVRTWSVMYTYFIKKRRSFKC